MDFIRTLEARHVRAIDTTDKVAENSGDAVNRRERPATASGNIEEFPAAWTDWLDRTLHARSRRASGRANPRTGS